MTTEDRVGFCIEGLSSVGKLVFMQIQSVQDLDLTALDNENCERLHSYLHQFCEGLHEMLVRAIALTGLSFCSKGVR